jgi:hypothetical protein
MLEIREYLDSILIELIFYPAYSVDDHPITDFPDAVWPDGGDLASAVGAGG